jgi:uncharacterized iron-regulated membrane protein
MDETFRKSMAWLHTWAGVVIGSVLFAIFWMGSLSVFDREVDRWMQPGTRLMTPSTSVSLDKVVVPIANTLAAGSAQWGVNLPTERAPQLRFFYRDAQGEFITRAIDPNTGQLIADQGSKAGTGFFFPFHFMLHLKWLDLGYWLVGVAGMAMLVLLVSGVIIHKKIFIDFFLFRPRKHLQRASLDLHNLTGVLALPFHFVITLSGLIIFIGVYFPQSHAGAYGFGKEAKAEYTLEAYGVYKRDKAKQPGTLASLDVMLSEAEKHWPGGKAFFVRVWHPGDANGYVEVRRSYANDVTMHLDRVTFDAQTGAVLHRFEAAPVMTVQRFISGMHFIQFDHWGLRWLYFAAGLSGCVLIATGFVFWLESRRASHAKKGLAGVRVVEALTIGSVTGVVVATLAFFVANRLLPLGASFAGQDRAALEMWAFYLVWLATFAHAAWRRAAPATQPARRAWREQCLAIAALAVLAVVLNGVTTGDHLVATLPRGYWPVAGIDLILLAAAGLAWWCSLRLGRSISGVLRAAPQPTSREHKVNPDYPPLAHPEHLVTRSAATDAGAHHA